MFVQKLSQVTEQLYRELPRSSFQTYVLYGVKLWCVQLDIEQNIANHILHYQQWSGVQDLTTYFWYDWQSEKKENESLLEATIRFKTQNKLNCLVKKIFNQINIKSGHMEFIALIAFVITAVGYWFYISNQPKQQSSPKEQSKNYPVNNITHQTPKPNKQFLVLVVTAAKAEIVYLMKKKGPLSVNDGEKLYELTQFLWLGSESDFHENYNKNNKYLVAENDRSEFDNYLVYFELKQGDEGFKPKVDQLTRYDAFRRLTDLTISFEISPRLKMEAYNNFELYNR